MDFVKLILMTVIWISLIIFYICIILIITPICVIHTCMVITYCMFEHKTFNLDKIRDELNKSLKSKVRDELSDLKNKRKP